MPLTDSTGGTTVVGVGAAAVVGVGEGAGVGSAAAGPAVPVGAAGVVGVGESPGVGSTASGPVVPVGAGMGLGPPHALTRKPKAATMETMIALCVTLVLAPHLDVSTYETSIIRVGLRLSYHPIVKW